MSDSLGDKIRLQHALDAIDAIESYVAESDFDAFSSNTMQQDACIRQLQIIGESCRKLSGRLTNHYPRVPWSEIIGMRNIVVHQYFGVDLAVVWAVIESDLPTFKLQIVDIVAELD